MELTGESSELRSAWRDLTWRQRRKILSDVGRGRRCEDRRDAALGAWAGMHQIRRSRYELPLAALGGTLAIVLVPAALDTLVGQQAFSVSLVRLWSFVPFLLAGSLGELSRRGQLRQGIVLNARFAAGEPVAGPADVEEAERLLRVIEREGWLRYHLERDKEPASRASQG